jgi:predicted phage tail protein
MTDKKIIRGAGGGGGGKGGGGSGRTPVEAPDSLRSIAYASVLDLVCEGEIEGLANGMQSVFLNETPLQNEDGSYNFTGATVYATNGSQGQSHIPGFPAVENEVTVNTEVVKATPITRQITNDDVDAVRVRISIPQLTTQNIENGDLNGARVQYQILMQSDGGGYIPQLIGSKWTGGASITSSTTARLTTAAYRMYISLTATAGSVYTVQYKKQSDPTWLTDGLTRVTQQAASGDGKLPVLASVIAEVFNGETWFMPTRDSALWEMRVVVTSGSVNIDYAAGDLGDIIATIDGKTTSEYERSHRIELTGAAPWDIRVLRITDDSTSVTLNNKTFWKSYTEIIDGKFRYPNSAIVGLRIDSSQFDSVPRRSYDLKMLKVKIPSNYDPEARTYSGVWDGTFSVAWTDNPAWCFYDLLTDTRYGLGDYIAEAQVDKWTLYTIGRYCDELVDNGQGGVEPRFTCNIYLQTREEAFKVVNAMASIFRGMPYWSSGSVTLGYDAPQDPVYQFTNANVINGEFNYTGSAAKARHSVALVAWNDPDDFYRQKIEYVEDATAIARYGIVQTEVAAIGCTSRGQANRVGRWILYTEQSETEVVSFKAGLEGFSVRPSQIIQVADEMRAGSRRGGRISSATTTAITVDMDVSGISGINSGTLSAILSDGTLETKNIASVSGSIITVSSAFTTAPAANSVYMIETPSVEAQLFKVISAVETQEGVEVTALAHNPNKYAQVENGIVLPPRQISSLSVKPSAPLNLSVSENLYEQNTQVLVQVTLSWSPIAGATAYEVAYKVDERNFVTLPRTQSTSIDIKDALEGFYVLKVVAINSIGKRSAPSEISAEIYGKTLPPQDVSNFSINIVNTDAHLTWDAVTDIDLSYYRIRFSPLTTGATYANAIDLLPRVSRPATFATVPAMTGTYFIKAVDKTNNDSVNATSITTIIENIKGLNLVETVTEHPTFAGTKTDVDVSDSNLILATSLFDDVSGDFDDATGNFDGGNGSVVSEGFYEFSNVVDLTAVYTSRVTAAIRQDRIDYINLFDDAAGLFDDREGQFDGDANAFDDVNVELYVSTTDDDPAGTPTWSGYRKFFVGDYKARAFRFKARLTSESGYSTPSVNYLEVTVDMPDRIASGSDISSGTDVGGKVVSFTPAFKITPAIGIAAQDLAQGDYFVISNKTNSSFTIKFYDSGANVVDRTFDYMAQGYGELAA